MGMHNAIVILFDGNLPSDRDVAKIATIVGGQNIRINVLSSEDLSKFIASLTLKTIIHKVGSKANVTIEETLRQSLVLIKEKYKGELRNRSIFVDKLACDLFEANRSISVYGCESDRVKDHVALLTAVKTIAETKYTDLPESYWKEFGITQEIYNHLNHLSQVCYV